MPQVSHQPPPRKLRLFPFEPLSLQISAIVFMIGSEHCSASVISFAIVSNEYDGVLEANYSNVQLELDDCGH